MNNAPYPFGVAQAESKAVNAQGNKTYYVIKHGGRYCIDNNGRGGFALGITVESASKFGSMSDVLSRLAKAHESGAWSVVRVIETVEQVPAKRVEDANGVQVVFACGFGSFVRFAKAGCSFVTAEYDASLNDATLFPSENSALTELQQGTKRFVQSPGYCGGILSQNLTMVRARVIPADTTVTRTETVVE
jgi:hypothetical protein